MNKSNTTLASKKGMSSLSRPKFAPGMLLQHDDLEQLNYYTRDLNRLMFRSLFGCGVMCGLVVNTDMDCGKLRITVGSGVALSCTGDPIEVPNPVPVLIDKDCHPDMAETLWVRLCGTTKCCAPRTSMCESDDDETKSECTRERDGYEILVESARPPCVCGCPEPKNDLADTPPKDTPGRGGAAGAGTATDPANRQFRITTGATDCRCVDPDKYPCYADHYAGLCGCHCDDCSDCDCKCILLARLDFNATDNAWTTDHSVRRFIRPVLMRDPQVEIELNKKKDGEGDKPVPPPAPPPTPPSPPPPAPTPATETAAETAAVKPPGKETKKNGGTKKNGRSR